MYVAEGEGEAEAEEEAEARRTVHLYNRRRPDHPQRRQRAHATCLVWGHVRCVYSERAVTVP